MIGLLNTSGDLKDALASQFEICDFDIQVFEPDSSPSLGGLFVDWLPQEMDEKHFFRQAAILQDYVKKGIPVVLFDRYTTIDQKQYRWLSKFNVTFLEPRINFREGFEWQPQWASPLPKKFEVPNTGKREIGIAYEGPLATQLKSFEKYYMTYATIFPDVEVVYHCTDLNVWKGQSQIDKLKHFEDHNLVKSEFDFSFVDVAVLIGSYKDYNSGYLPNNLFTMLNKGCIPLLPIEHRFFATMFDQLIIRNERDLDYAFRSFPKVKQVIIEEIYDNIFKRFPEFQLHYMVEKLKRCLMI
jgi:hypothetical protein